MRTKQRMIRKVKKWFSRGEAGFAMIVALVAILVISVLGAASLLLMVSSLRGIVNMTPEQRAFKVTESGLYVGHAMIVEGKVGTGVTKKDDALGGEYEVTVMPKNGSTTEFVITSTGSYQDGGSTYRRKVEEEVYYSGEQAYDAMRIYMFFAGRNLTCYVPGEQNNYPIWLSGNIRAENDVFIGTYCRESTWDYLVIRGSIEGGNSVTIDAGGTYYYEDQPYDFYGYPKRTPNPLDTKGMNLWIYGDIKAGSAWDTSTSGHVNLSAWSGETTMSGGRYAFLREGYTDGRTTLGAATDGSTTNYEIHTTSPANLYTYIPPANHDRLRTGTHVVDRSVQKVYIPEPDFEYYKAMAMEQDATGDPHFFDVGAGGVATLPHDIKKSGISSMSVYYSTGDMKLVDSEWVEEQTNGIFVCEGDFITEGSYAMKENCKFQVIAGGDVNITKDADNRSIAAVNEYFFYSRNDVNMCMTHFDVNNVQVTALRDINLSAEDEFSYAEFKYRAPQLDIAAWPIDITVTAWRELPVDSP